MTPSAAPWAWSPEGRSYSNTVRGPGSRDRQQARGHRKFRTVRRATLGIAQGGGGQVGCT